MKSEHQQRVEQFMRLAKQDVPNTPTEPSKEVRLLRARLIFEEAMETIRNGLGVCVAIKESYGQYIDIGARLDDLEFALDYPFNMTETIDGCCDLSVVTIGTLSAIGVLDLPFLRLVDENNLAKFGPGHTIREDGKLIKPLNHKPPDIASKLHELSDWIDAGR